MKKSLQRQLRHAFGFDPDVSTHHFVVTIPRGTLDEIGVSEHYGWDARTGSGAASLSRGDGQMRVFIPRPKWDAVADALRAHFNQRLKAQGVRTGSWQVGRNLLRRDLGKELVLLGWAIADADPALIPTAVANWNGLEPTERWWLYTQTAATSGHAVNDKTKGWRKAVRFALTENPVTADVATEARVPGYFERAAGPLFQGPRWDDVDPADPDE